jgi:hypothetical protein
MDWIMTHVGLNNFDTMAQGSCIKKFEEDKMSSKC